jgi:hypothetical protein
MEQLSKKELSIISAISLVLTLIIFSRTELFIESHPDFIKSWDHHKYIFMAQHPMQFHIAPFCWRIVQPLLASILPFSLQTNFILISIVSVSLSGIFTYSALKCYGLSPMISLIGMLMFYSTSWASKWPLFNFWLIDSMINMCVTFAVVLIVCKQDRWLMILLSIGVLIKESILLVVPLYYSFNAKSFWDKNKLFDTLRIVAPSILILLSLRVLIPECNSDDTYVSSLDPKMTVEQPMGTSHKISEGELRTRGQQKLIHYNYIELVKNIGWNRLTNTTFSDLRILTTRTYGVVILFLVLFASVVKRRLFLRIVPFILFGYIQLFVAVNTERLLIITLPAFILLAAYGIELLHQQYNVDHKIFIFVFSSIIILNLISTTPVPYQYGREWFIFCMGGLFYVFYRNSSLSKKYI